MVVLWSVLALAGVALAQGDGNLPRNWPELVALLFSGGMSIPILLQAVRRGIHWDELLRSKTVYAALSGFLTALGLFASGTLGLPGLVGAFYLMLVAVFLRDGLAATRAQPQIKEPSPEDYRY